MGVVLLAAAVARVATSWALRAVEGQNPVRLGFLTDRSGRLGEFEQHARISNLDAAQVRAAIAAVPG